MSFAAGAISIKPLSTRIEDDIIMSLIQIDYINEAIEQSITTEKSLTDKVELSISNVIAVFNQNIDFIIEELKHCPKSVNISCDQDSNEKERSYLNHPETLKALEELDSNIELKRNKDIRIHIAELHKLGQLCYPLGHLLLKIEGAIERLQIAIAPRTIQLSPKTLQLCKLESIPFSSKFPAPCLRTITPPVAKNSLMQQPVVAPTPEPKKVAVATSFTIEDGTILGICCDPEWERKPIAFEKGENGWTGQLPVGKDWKCVILQGGQVVQWEKYKGNRRECEGIINDVLTFNVNF